MSIVHWWHWCCRCRGLPFPVGTTKQTCCLNELLHRRVPKQPQDQQNSLFMPRWLLDILCIWFVVPKKMYVLVYTYIYLKEREIFGRVPVHIYYTQVLFQFEWISFLDIFLWIGEKKSTEWQPAWHMFSLFPREFTHFFRDSLERSESRPTFMARIHFWLWCLSITWGWGGKKVSKDYG